LKWIPFTSKGLWKELGKFTEHVCLCRILGK
jgi:hypothetical protein